VKSSSKPDCEIPAEEPSIAHTTGKTIIPTAPLPDHIAKNIDAIVALHTTAERVVPQHQRVVESVTAFFGRPAFLYGILLVITLWLIPNSLPRRWRLPRFDPPPFSWLQLSVGIGSLLVTTGVLIKQERQEKLAEQRAQLSLQLHLLSEQKIAKLIALVEELRCDLPNVKDRYDPEAEDMKQAADPHIVMNALEERLTEELTELQKQETST
jgi:uncharacterized membrane protein